jgi:tetratricopeptide (TPR) repeat protein
MISCKECATLNSIDSAFCKKCGKALAQEEALDARESLEKQLDHGFQLFHHGRTDEAWLNVESCLIADPENLRALSLKGLILERRGLILEALECHETIVAKDPNAALERMKVQTLRGLLDARKYQAPTTDKRLALAIAVCVTLLVISVAGAFALSRNPQPSHVAMNQPETPTYKVESFPQTKNPQTAAKQSQEETEGPATTDDGTERPAALQPQPNERRTAATPLNGTLPDPTRTISEGGQDFKPVDPLANAQIQPLQTQQAVSAATTNGNVGGPTSGSQSNDPDPSAVDPADTKPSRPPQVIDIKLSPNQAPTRSNEPAIDANGIEAMVRTARGLYQVGSYQSAASTYEKALSAGADPAMTNQRLAQCYERLGRTGDAKVAYGRAINAIQDQINGGRGNKDRLLAALNSSQQALKNLQGG